MFGYTIVDSAQTFSISADRLDAIFAYSAEYFPHAQKGILNIAFVSDEMMQTLNRDYRGIDKTTDVLSFHYFEDFSGLSPEEVAWECIFSEAKILAQASEHGHTPQEEFEILLIHSVLHILWFDHETDEDFASMWQYEVSAREYFGLSTRR